MKSSRQGHEPVCWNVYTNVCIIITNFTIIVYTVWQQQQNEVQWFHKNPIEQTWIYQLEYTMLHEGIYNI